MIALSFTNLVFFSYAIYLALEKKLEVYKSGKFWLMIFGLCISMYITFICLSEQMPLELENALKAP